MERVTPGSILRGPVCCYARSWFLDHVRFAVQIMKKNEDLANVWDPFDDEEDEGLPEWSLDEQTESFSKYAIGCATDFHPDQGELKHTVVAHHTTAKSPPEGSSASPKTPHLSSKEPVAPPKHCHYAESYR
jgi:hypothetical protein